MPESEDEFNPDDVYAYLSPEPTGGLHLVIISAGEIVRAMREHEPRCRSSLDIDVLREWAIVHWAWKPDDQCCEADKKTPTKEYKQFVATIHAVCEFQERMIGHDLGPQAAMPIDWSYLREYAENLLPGLENK